jgi:hypothetical protein
MVSTQLSASVEASLMELQAMEEDERPESLFRCMQEDGEINLHMYSEYTEKEDELDAAQDALWKAWAEDRLPTRKKTIQKRRTNEHKMSPEDQVSATPLFRGWQTGVPEAQRDCLVLPLCPVPSNGRS